MQTLKTELKALTKLAGVITLVAAAAWVAQQYIWMLWIIAG